MGDYCDQCAEELGLPPGDFVGLTTHEEETAGLLAFADCTGCGTTRVDSTGHCVGGCASGAHLRG